MYKVSDEVRVKKVHRIIGDRIDTKPRVNLVLEMPESLWLRIHKAFNVDEFGKPISRYTLSQLIWEQKNRKEKEK